MYNPGICPDSVSNLKAMAITDEQRNAIVKPVRDGLIELVTGSPGLFRNRPGFIAGEGPNDRFSGAVRAISQLNCRIWAARPKEAYSTNVNQTNAALCDPYLQSIGEQPPDGSLDVPFVGGQCSGTVYQVSGTYTVSCGPQTGQTANWVGSRNLTGPIGGIGLSEGGDAWVLLHAGPFAQPIRADNFIGLSPVPRAGVTCGQIGDSNSASETRPTITSIVAVSGPDNCGSPDPDLIPPGQSQPIIVPPPTVNVDIPGIGPTTIGVDLDADGNLVVTVPELGVTFTVPVVGGGDSAVAPTSPGDAGSPADTGAGGEATGTAPDGQELTGVLVTVLTAPGSANTFDNVSAQVFRGIGYVSMGYPGLLGVDTSAAVVESPQFFHAQQRGLSSWRVRANVGFSLRSTPYYREVTE